MMEIQTSDERALVLKAAGWFLETGFTSVEIFTRVICMMHVIAVSYLTYSLHLHKYIYISYGLHLSCLVTNRAYCEVYSHICILY